MTGLFFMFAMAVPQILTNRRSTMSKGQSCINAPAKKAGYKKPKKKKKPKSCGCSH
jgi:hypothetical protein